MGKQKIRDYPFSIFSYHTNQIVDTKILTSPFGGSGLNIICKFQAIIIVCILSFARPLELLAQSSTFLQNWLQTNNAKANFEATTIGFKQPMVKVTIITSTITIKPNVVLPLGMVLKSTNANFGDLIVADDTSITDWSTEVNTFVLGYATKSVFPSAATAYTYTLDQINPNTELINTLKKVKASGTANQLGSQIAVWSAHEQQSVEKTLINIKDKLPTLQTADIELAQSLRGEKIATITATATKILTPSATTSLASPNSPSSSTLSPVTSIIFIVVGSLALVAALMTRLSSKGKPQFSTITNVSAGEITNAVELQLASDSVSLPSTPLISKQSLNPSQKTEIFPAHHPQAGGSGVKLTCIEGPLLGEVLSINDRHIISREAIPQLSISLRSISSPHMLIDLSSDKPSIKDLHSTNGVFVNNEKITDWHEISFEQSFIIATTEVRLTKSHLEVIGGELKGRRYVLPAKYFMLCESEVQIFNTQKKDMKISDAHTMLDYDRDENVVVVKDLNSRNGTFINDELVVNKYQARIGDKVTCGCCIFEVRI